MARENAAEVNWNATKLKATLESLPADLVPHFRSLVEDVQFQCTSRGYMPFRQWRVLAALVESGWRQTK